MSPRLLTPGAGRWLSGLLAGAVLVAVVTVVVGLLERRLPVLSLLVLCLLVLCLLGVFLVTALVAAELAGRSRRAVLASARLGEEQSALRRVATLVAQGDPPASVFEAVTREVGLLSGADLARMERYEHDGAVTGVAAWSGVPDQLAVGTRFDLQGLSVARAVRDVGGPVRLDSFAGATGGIAGEARALGIRSSVGCPIVVAGQLWGVIAASTKRDEPFPAETESQMASFTELVATAVEHAESRAELRRVAAEQAALRRVATLVAHGVAPELVFAAVAEEVGRLTGAHVAAISRFDADGLATVLAVHGLTEEDDGIEIGTRWKPEPPTPIASVQATGRSARYDVGSETPDTGLILIRDRQIRSAVASPIVVEGRCWGAIGLASRHRPFPPDCEPRLVEFTEIVATAIANAQSRMELAASRARVVAAADEMRRRIERDLHDGAQQRLVSLALELRLAQDSVPDQQRDLRAGIGRAADGLAEILEQLREISHGIHPAILSEGGLGPALRTLARRSAVPVELHMGTGSRYPRPVEVAAYYVVSEALANTAKHADASLAEVAVEQRAGALLIRVADDGLGGADLRLGSGLVGLHDRVEALGGSIDVASPAGDGTRIEVSLPVDAGSAGSPRPDPT